MEKFNSANSIAYSKLVLYCSCFRNYFSFLTSVSIVSRFSVLAVQISCVRIIFFIPLGAMNVKQYDLCYSYDKIITLFTIPTYI
jgi:hypothetical protein